MSGKMQDTRMKPLRRPRSTNVPPTLFQEILALDRQRGKHIMYENENLPKTAAICGNSELSKALGMAFRDPQYHEQRRANIVAYHRSRGYERPPIMFIEEDVQDHCSLSNSSTEDSFSSITSYDKRRQPIPPKNSIMFHEARYKTELCRQFIEQGVCEYTDRCLFAHGAYELKSLPHRHPKFKTERCSAFHDIGFCAFGPRCSFIHLPKNDASEILQSLVKNTPKLPMPENPFEDETSTSSPEGYGGFTFPPRPSNSRLPVFVKLCEQEANRFINDKILRGTS